jgi:hypothetical protein
MRKTVLFILSTVLLSGATVQAEAAGHRFHNGRSYAATLTNHKERSLDFGFGGTDSSRPGGEDPNLNPSGS